MKKIVTKSLFIGIVALGLLFTACNNSQSKQSNADHHQNDSIYACPMHPEETGKPDDKCTKCGMDLVLVSSEDSKKSEVRLITEPQNIKAGTATKLTFTFKENGNTIPLEISQEMKIHLMVVDENLSWFRHIHPKEQTDGSYAIKETFPTGGQYFLFSDFKPQGKTSVVDKKEITIQGSSENETDFSVKLVSVIDGYTVTLENGNDFKTNKAQSLEISLAKNGEKIVESDIEPYLGATAHIAMISKEDKDFLHIHPISGKHFPIYAETNIEKPGIYRIWVEFQTNGKVHTADFTVNVADNEEASQDHIGHQH